MIIETIVSTVNAAGQPNFAPMGVRFLSPDILVIRPFSGSKTNKNLKAMGEGVVNIVDNALLFVETALFSRIPPHVQAKTARSPILKEACSFFEFIVADFNDACEPAEVKCKVLESGYRKRFNGFCRASFAVLEATILVTRLHLLDRRTVNNKLADWQELVEKTGGEQEIKGFQMIVDYVRSYY